ncbi:uncharacterized protein LOC143584020 [Bidens hawaiensis]|uniref:uncharacterized protein LOC143584020 n=1 Tax=Bidens hawaiensis TaxID=980011 RepID=UPI00404A35AE
MAANSIPDDRNTESPPMHSESTQSSPPPKPAKSAGIRVIGRRIYDSKNGKTCHQCRQKTLDFVATCTNQTGNNKKCPLNVSNEQVNLVAHFALIHTRLRDFGCPYGENAEEAAASGDWICPRCRGVCNCSFCMKKKGCIPTGSLTRIAIQNGYKSVSNLLNMEGSAVTEVKYGARKKRSADDKETGDEPETKLMKEDAESESCQEEKSTVEDTSEDYDVELQLPPGTELTNLAGVDLPPGDIRHALQLLEFCEAFGEVLQLKTRDSEILLSELASENAHKTQESLIVRFHTRLLSLIEEDLGRRYSENSWVEAFKECISESQYPSKDSLLECFNLQLNGYDELSFSKKLRLLNFLCDESLGTVRLRLWIEEKNVEEKKAAKERLIANREKEKDIKKKVHDEVAKAIASRNRIQLSISEHNDIISKLKAESAQILANSMEMRDVARESYVVRSQPVLLDINGCKLWKLRSHYEKLSILLQDSCYEDVTTSMRNGLLTMIKRRH